MHFQDIHPGPVRRVLRDVSSRNVKHYNKRCHRKLSYRLQRVDYGALVHLSGIPYKPNFSSYFFGDEEGKRGSFKLFFAKVSDSFDMIGHNLCVQRALVR